MSFTVQEVAQLLKQAKENEKPYVFFTGAGCSVKADVPSATGLIQEICEKFPIQVKKLDPEKDKYNYGKYMSALDKAERRQLLKPHIIDNKKINWAHIALACLMQAGYVQRVLTFNFDSILSRACNLLGLHPSIYDFATANPHLYHLINDPSIVHLHGQGTGFVQLNTDNETKRHTKKLGEFIAATLNTNPSLFIGYSGNADAFFPLLEQKYSEQHRLIWTGTKNTINELESDAVRNFLNKNSNLTHYIGNIFADDFLVLIAKELECFPPELFSNPYAFLNKQLDFIQPYPLEDGLDVLANLSYYLKEQANKPLINTLYTAFIHKYPDFESTQDLNAKELNEIMWAYNKQALIFLKNKYHTEAINLWNKALNIDPNHMWCLLNLCSSLIELNQENIDNSNHLLLADKYSLQALNTYPNNNHVKVVRAQVTLSIGIANSDRNKFIEAIKIFEEVKASQHSETWYYSDFGIALSELAKLDRDQDTFHRSFSVYDECIKNEIDNIQTYENYISSIFDYLHIEYDEELLNKSFELIKTVLIHKPNDTYNLACYYAIKNEVVQCTNYLLHAEQHNTLPDLQHLSQDQDLDSIRNEPWFIELLDRLKAKEEAEKVA